MSTYEVDVAVAAVVRVTVQAESRDQAIEKATEAAGDPDQFKALPIVQELVPYGIDDVGRVVSS